MLGPTSRSTDYAQPRVSKGSWSQQGEHPHGVQFYSQDKFLLEERSEYVGNALRAGDAAVVIATEQHCDGLLPGLMAQGWTLPNSSRRDDLCPWTQCRCLLCERLRQLGGVLSVRSNGGGTLVTAELPVG